MLLLNFSHPLTEAQYEKIAALADMPIEEIRTIRVQILQEEPLEPQIVSVVDSVGLSSHEWQAHSLLINPPGYAPAATYEAAELLNLQTIRDAARERR